MAFKRIKKQDEVMETALEEVEEEQQMYRPQREVKRPPIQPQRKKVTGFKAIEIPQTYQMAIENSENGESLNIYEAMALMLNFQVRILALIEEGSD